MWMLGSERLIVEVSGGLVTDTDPNKAKSDQTLSSVSCVVDLTRGSSRTVCP